MLEPTLQQGVQRYAESSPKTFGRAVSGSRCVGAGSINFIYYFDASRNYDPRAHLDRITVPVLYINSADDFINPAGFRIAEAMAKKMPKPQFILLPITDATRGMAHMRRLQLDGSPSRVDGQV